MVNVFAVPVFFIVFRETLETAIIVSVLLSFLKQQFDGSEQEKNAAIYKKLRNQVWYGTLAGLLLCLIIGAGLIGAFYGLKSDAWSGAEYIWEGVFCIVSSIIISIMGAALLRVSKIQQKWRIKLAKALEPKADKSATTSTLTFKQKTKLWTQKYIMFMVPFITILREGLEAIAFISGISLSVPATSIPLATITGLLAGGLIGFIIYKCGNRLSLQLFLIISTCFLYLVAAGLFSRGVWYLEADAWNRITGGDAAENGSGPGSYDIRKSVWHVNCCNPELNGGGGWGIFNSLLGWQNSATVGSVVSYNLYWLVVILGFLALRFKERRGRWPFMKPSTNNNQIAGVSNIQDETRTTSVVGKQSDSETSSDDNIATTTLTEKSTTGPSIHVSAV